MRIVDHAEFLAMPPNTVYCKYETTGNLGEICIKRDSYKSVDWHYTAIASFEFHSSTELFDKLFEAERDSAYEIPNNSTDWQRDGLFNEDQKFVVFSAADVKGMIDALAATISQDAL